MWDTKPIAGAFSQPLDAGREAYTYPSAPHRASHPRSESSFFRRAASFSCPGVLGVSSEAGSEVVS